jgi:hypothetical protein
MARSQRRNTQNLWALDIPSTDRFAIFVFPRTHHD